MFSKKLRALAFFLMTLMVFYVIPLNCMQDIVSALSSDETINSTEESKTSFDEEPYVLGEDLSKREESAKHFRMSDGSYVAVQYAEPVHYLDENGEYTEYDNTLTIAPSTSGGLMGNIQIGSLTAGNITAINGFKANKSDISITLANSANQSALTSISKGEYSVSIIPLSLNTSSKVVVNNTTAKPTLGGKPTIEEASKLYNHTSSVKYTSMFNGADLEYVLSGSKLKENIIVNEKSTSYVYRFNLNLTGLYAVLNEDGSISLLGNNTDKIEFTIPKGYMFDAAGNYSEGVTYALSSKPNGNYTLTVTADSEWINSDARVFPVTVDPTISYRQSGMTSVALGSDGTRFQNTYIKVGKNASTGYETYWKTSVLPTIPSNAYVSEATLTLNFLQDGISHGNSFIYAYCPESDWNPDTVPYNVSNSNIVSYFLFDSNAPINSPRHSLNITELAKLWCSGESNYGLLLRSDSLSLIRFSINNNNNTDPLLMIKYVNINGLEDYWTYSSYPIFDLGSANINLATGKLSLSLGTLSTTDFLMPYMPTLTYNSTQAGLYNVSSNATVPYKQSTAGMGFKWSMSETIVEKELPDVNGQKTYYVFSDSDGTEHYFTENEDTGKIVDEDGLGLELTYSSSNYTIKYPDKTVKTFTKKSDGTYFVAGGILNSIKDRIGNQIKFGLNTYGGVGTVSVYPNGSSTITSQLKITHNNNCKVNLVANNSTKEAFIFYYSSSQTGGTLSTGGSGYLRKINRVRYTGTSTSPSWSDFMTGATTEDFVVEETYLLTYSNKYLKTISDVNADKQYDFTTTNNKTNIVCEKAKLSSLVLGCKNTFTYGEGFTKIRTPGNDDVHGNTDDIMTSYTFDNWGRNKTCYSYTVDKSYIYGGAGYVYENEMGDYTNINRVKNNLKSSSVAKGNDTNYLLNGDFEKGAYVTAANAIAWKTNNFSLNTVNGIYGEIANNASSGYIEQSVYLSPGAYTLSFDTWTSGSTGDLDCKMSATVGSVNLNEEIFSVDKEKSNPSMTFNVSSSSKVIIKIEVTDSALSKYICIDNIMLVADSTSSNFSLVQNGNFEKIHYGTSGSVKDISSSLWNFNGSTSCGFDTYSDTRMGRSLKIIGSVPQEVQVSQTIYNYSGVSPNGFNLNVSGYALGTDQINAQDSVFALRVDVYPYEGEVGSYYINFEPNIEGEWQFSSQTLYFSSEHNTISSIVITCEYSNHPGVAYFDNISAYVVPVESNQYNLYYTDEEDPGYGLLMTSVKGEHKDFYVYNQNQDVIKHAIINGEEGEIYDYEYEGVLLSKEKHYSFNGRYNWTGKPSYGDTEFFPEKNITKTLLSETLYDYNNYGQITETVFIPIDVNNQQEIPIKTSYKYKTTAGSKIFGALTETTDTLGKTTKYFYDETKGLLLAEVYPDNTGLAYEYDGKNRLVLTVPVTYNGTTTTKITNQEKASYSYNSKGYLSQISTDSTTYTFTYDNFGNTDTVKAGNNTLADYTYNSNNGKLKSLTYGNGDEVEYVYDALDRVIQICYNKNAGNKETLYEYSYTSDGYLKRFDNNVENTITIYSYDGSGKLISTIECEQDKTIPIYSINYVYDKLNRTQSIKTFLNDEDSNAKYALQSNNHYDHQGRIDNVTYSETYSGINGNVSLVYDNINRLKTKNVNFSGFSQSVSYTYEERNTTDEDTTSTRIKEYQSIIGNVTKNYTYTYDDSGNIYKELIESNDGSRTTTYGYDDLGQLISYSQNSLYKTYSYDNAGNILSRTERDHSNGTVNSYTYTYGDSQWGDLLTAFNGNTITYDAIGNPLQYYNGNVFTWKQGRRLDTVSRNGSVVASYNYDENGIRTSKTINGVEHKFILNGSQIVAELWGNQIVIYLYDEIGSPVGMVYRNSNMAAGVYETYFFEKNMFGDILAVYNTSGVKQVSYTYDAFGKCTTTTHVSSNALINSLRYRGYYYDSETGFYYLNSRYYDPVTCRFINADDSDVLFASPYALTDKNLFAYCDNNPVIREDETGYFWNYVIGAAVSAVVNVATTYIAAKVTGQEYTWKDAAVAAISGAVNVIPVVGTVLSGAITGTYTGIMAYNNGASVGASIGVGLFAGLCTTASIGNIANATGEMLDIATNATVDLVFGTGYNSMSAATYKAVTSTPKVIENKALSKIKCANSQSRRNRAVSILERGLLY